MCGADRLPLRNANGWVGSSPRVRSGRCGTTPNSSAVGIISACAERTSASHPAQSNPRDHLRVCGADTVDAWVKHPKSGSSPRVRSGPRSCPARSSGSGIISACAERTAPDSCTNPPARDHLRVCGADFQGPACMWPPPGSSPRVRSGLQDRVRRRSDRGIISACAERTACSASTRRAGWDHLRVCGADDEDWSNPDVLRGSSPRVRSGHHPHARHLRQRGIISACAERTEHGLREYHPPWDHLRVCGADSQSIETTMGKAGSSPRVRSGPTPPVRIQRITGIISACAERT